MTLSSFLTAPLSFFLGSICSSFPSVWTHLGGDGRFQRRIGRERDQMRRERDAALRKIADLERLNDEILRGVPDWEPRPELEPEPEPEPPPQPARRHREAPAPPRGHTTAGAASEVDDARQARLVQIAAERTQRNTSPPGGPRLRVQSAGRQAPATPRNETPEPEPAPVELRGIDCPYATPSTIAPFTRRSFVQFDLLGSIYSGQFSSSLF